MVARVYTQLLEAVDDLFYDDLMLLEVAQPSSLIMRIGHGIYFNKIVPLIGGILSDKEAYQYLPASVSYLPPTAAIIEMLVNAGFSEISHALLTTGAAQLFTAKKR